ncbi:MAG TPA: M28 family peptidase [Pyrinomonadaceae bacterium]|nr:M28 family peptidase [Pyrinomonadaceae bacterium]
MSQQYDTDEKGRAHTFRGADSLTSLAGFLFITLFACAGLYQLAPPRAARADAPPSEFSSARAMKHLEVLARAPRPRGSAEHERARAYILQELSGLGLAAETQETEVVSNITARLKGTGVGRAVLIAAHYDTVRHSPGAGDDGAAVASMLETARALRAGPALTNDVIFLFTDGEEAGLLGAKAFVYNNPAFKDVGLALNFDARGNSGPVLMFQTSEHSGWLIRQFAAAAPHPVANSFMSEIYDHLPNDTDFTILREGGAPGLNFANINGYAHYHSDTDTVASLSEPTLQHQGSYMLALARHFGGTNLAEARTGGAVVYFNTLGGRSLVYPRSWVAPLTLSGLLLFVGVVALGFRRRRLSWAGIGQGFLSVLLGLIAVPGVVSLAWSLIPKTPESERQVIASGARFDTDLFTLGFVCFAVAVTSALYSWFGRKTDLASLSVGGLVWWLLLTLALPLYMPGGSYLFIWPLLFSLAGLAYTLLSAERRAGGLDQTVVLLLCAAPAVVLCAPMIYLLFVGLGVNKAGFVMVLVVLLSGLLIPHLRIKATPHRWLLPGLLALAGIGFLLAGNSAPDVQKTYPRQASAVGAGKQLRSFPEDAENEKTLQAVGAGAFGPGRPLPAGLPGS